MRVLAGIIGTVGVFTEHALGVVLQHDTPPKNFVDDEVGDDDQDNTVGVYASTRGRWSAGYSRNCMDNVKGTSFETKPHEQVDTPWKTPQWPPPKMEPKLAMLFFVNKQILNEDLWVAWLEQAKRHNVPFHIAIHTKSENITLDPRLRIYLHKEHVQNDKCNLWSAQWALLNPLLENEKYGDISHFMMLSENAVPVKPLHKIYSQLERQPLSRLCVDDNFVRPRAESWWMMRRDDMMWFHTYNQTIYNYFAKGCIDENLWYGALKERRRQFPVQGQILDECWMYVNWRLRADGGCKDWKRVAEHTHTPHLDTEPHVNTTSGHPTSWFNVSARAFNELYRSTHWFARKFTDGAVPVEVASSMLEQ